MDPDHVQLLLKKKKRKIVSAVDFSEIMPLYYPCNTFNLNDGYRYNLKAIEIIQLERKEKESTYGSNDARRVVWDRFRGRCPLRGFKS